MGFQSVVVGRSIRWSYHINIICTDDPSKAFVKLDWQAIGARRFVCTSVILPSQDCWASGDSCFVRLAKQLSCADWSCGLFCTIPGKSSPWTCMFGKKAWRVCDDCAIRGFYAPDGVLGGFSLCHSARARIRTPRALSNSTFSSFDYVKWEACSWQKWYFTRMLYPTDETEFGRCQGNFRRPKLGMRFIRLCMRVQLDLLEDGPK